MDTLVVIIGVAGGLLLARFLAPAIEPVLLPFMRAVLRATPRHRRMGRAFTEVMDDLKARRPESPDQP